MEYTGIERRKTTYLQSWVDQHLGFVLGFLKVLSATLTILGYSITLYGAWRSYYIFEFPIWMSLCQIVTHVSLWHFIGRYADKRFFGERDDESLNTKNSGPPRSMTYLANLFTPSQQREAIEGDLLESYRRMEAKYGPRAAQFDYACQIASLLWPRIRGLFSALWKFVVLRWISG